MSNIFMTVVGTGDYAEAEYVLGSESCKNRFVQKSLLTLLRNSGEEFDRIIFFLTDRAKEMNWDEYTRRDKNNEGKLITDEGLKTFLDNNFPDKYEVVDICNGGNEDEILDLFQSIYDAMDDGDEITFDVTHGFRSIPFLFYPVMSYAKELKNVIIKHIYYGLYVSAGIPAEIIDLKKYDEILDWANAAHNFRISGNASEIAELSQKRINSMIGEEKRYFSGANCVSKNLLEFTEAILTCQGDDSNKSIIKKYKNTTGSAEKLESSAFRKEYMPFDEILNHAIDTVRCFDGKTKHHEIGLEVIKWCMDRKLIQQAYTAIQETVISYLCYVFGENYNALDREFREDVVSKALNAVVRSFRGREFILDELYDLPLFHEKKEYAVIFVKMVNFLDASKLKFIQQIKVIRNKMNHFGMNKDTPEIDMEILEKHYKNTLELIDNIESRRNEILSDEEAMKIVNEYFPVQSAVFVNFSNHPSENWDDEQKIAAAEIVPECEIIDVPFPQVEGIADEKEIKRISNECIDMIVKLCPTAVMCQGEFGVCWKVVSALKKRGIKVVYSCSDRKAAEVKTENGVEKTSVFRFVRFREYE